VTDDWDFDEELGGTFALDKERADVPADEPVPGFADND